MRRFLIDFCLILVFVMLGRELNNEADSMKFEEKIDEFNQKVQNKEVVDHPSYLHLNQIEENAAGKLGDSLSSVIYETVYHTMEVIAMIFDENE